MNNKYNNTTTLHYSASVLHFVAAVTVVFLFTVRDVSKSIMFGIYRHSISFVTPNSIEYPTTPGNHTLHTNSRNEHSDIPDDNKMKNVKIKINSNKITEVDPSLLFLLIILFEVVTSMFHILQARYPRDKACPNTLRWIEYSITATIMIVIISFLSGVKDIDTIISNITNTVVIMMLGLIIESLIYSKSEDPSIRTIIIILTVSGWILFSSVWTSIISNFNYTLNDTQASNENGENIPNIVYYIVYMLLVLYGCFGVVQILHFLKVYKHDQIERIYVILSFVAKITLTSMIMGGITRPVDDGN